jgi:myo-inositol-1(or 4)-monophosphatase
MADVDFGFVHDFGANEEFVAERGGGATLDGEEIRVGDDREKLEVLGLEAAEPSRALPVLEALDGRVYRLRVVGSIAITAAYVAAGRFDAMLSLRPCRSVDIAAAQLIVREAGGLVAFIAYDDPLGAPLDLEPRSPVIAARTEAGLAAAATLPVWPQ